MKRLSFMQSVFRSMGLLSFLTTTTIFYSINVLEITAKYIKIILDKVFS